ncbi:MAG: HAD-IA family hydrolase [Nitrospirota bacterium]
MKIKLIIFDLDGTLVDSSIDITNALNYAIEPYNFKKLTVEKTVSMVGEGITRLIEKLLGENNSEIKPDVLKRFMDYYSDHLTDFTKSYPGVRETLEELRNYKKAIISNKREFLSRRLLEDLELSKYFDIILGSDSIDEKKPSPKPVLKALEILSLTPEEAVIVGDSDYDIIAGKAAGAITIAASYGFRDISLLGDADFIIDSFSELKSKLDEINRR